MQQLNITQVLERVNDMYLPGAINFYARMPNDPWSEAHEDFANEIEKAPTEANPFDGISMAGHIFLARIKKLIEEYRPFSKGAKEDVRVTGFMSNNETQATKRAIKKQLCVSCGAEDDLKIIRHPNLGLGIFCRLCAAAK